MKIKLILFAVLAFVSGQAFSSQDIRGEMIEEGDPQEEQALVSYLFTPGDRDICQQHLPQFLKLKDFKNLSLVSKTFKAVFSDPRTLFRGGYLVSGWEFSRTANFPCPLRLVEIHNNQDLTNDDLKKFGEATYVDLQGCENITNFGLKYLRNVKILNLVGCPKITLSDFKIFLLKNLEDLTLSQWGCSLQGPPLEEKPQRATRSPKIRDFPLSLTDLTLANSTEELNFSETVLPKTLTNLTIRGCPQFTNEDIPDLVTIINRDIKNLEHLTIEGCPGVTKKGVKTLKKGLPKKCKVTFIPVDERKKTQDKKGKKKKSKKDKKKVEKKNKSIKSFFGR